MPNVTLTARARTALRLEATDGTVATVQRIALPVVAGYPTRFRMYRVHIQPRDQVAADVTVSRPLLKQLLKGGARIVGRIAA